MDGLIRADPAIVPQVTPLLDLQPIKPFFDLILERLRSQVSVPRGHLKGRVSKHGRDRAHRRAAHHHPTAAGVTQQMEGNIIRQLCFDERHLELRPSHCLI